MTISDKPRLVVQRVVGLPILRDPKTRGHRVKMVLEAAAKDEMRSWLGWTLGPITYHPTLRVPHGVIPKNKPHPLEGQKATDATLDALIAQLDETGFVWLMSAQADVLC